MREKILSKGSYLILADIHLNEQWSFSFEKYLKMELKRLHKREGKKFKGIIVLGDFINARCNLMKVRTANRGVWKILDKELEKGKELYFVKGNNDSKLADYDRLIGFQNGKKVIFEHGHRFTPYCKLGLLLNLFKRKNRFSRPGKKNYRYINNVNKAAKKDNAVYIVGHGHFDYFGSNVKVIYQSYLIRLDEEGRSL